MAVLHAGLYEFVPPLPPSAGPPPLDPKERLFPRSPDPDSHLHRLLTMAMFDIISVIAHFKPAHVKQGRARASKAAVPKSSIDQFELNVRAAVAGVLAWLQLKALREHGGRITAALEAPPSPPNALLGLVQGAARPLVDMAVGALEAATSKLFGHALVRETQRLKQNEALKVLLDAAVAVEAGRGAGLGLSATEGGLEPKEGPSKSGDEADEAKRGLSALSEAKDMGELMGALSEGIDEDDLKALEKELEQHFNDGQPRTIIHMTGYVSLDSRL